MDRLKENMDERLKRVEEAKYLLSIKGLGVVTVARFFGEVGDIRCYPLIP